MQDGSVKLSRFVNHQLQETAVVCELEYPVYRLAQSMTGHLLTVSLGNEEEQTFLYQEGEDWSKWNCVQQLQ
jgi:hypothetical protein